MPSPTSLSVLEGKIEAHRSTLAEIKQHLDELDDKLAALVSDAIHKGREPGPYQDLAAAVKALQDDHDITRRVMASLEALNERQGVPTLTVRHWRDLSQGGRWCYETTVTIRPDEVTSLPNTLEYVDAAARQEAKRREGQDSRD
jgi:hypothetical protein